MAFDNVRVIGMRAGDEERFSAVSVCPGTVERTREGELRTGPTIDRHGRALLESAGASVMQPESELRKKLAELGMPAETIGQKFDTARLWMTTVAVTEPA